MSTIDMNNFGDSDYSTTEKVETHTCKDCNKEFKVNVAYDKNGLVVSFVPKYCTECNTKMITDININGTAIIGSTKLPKEKVEGLVEAIVHIKTLLIALHIMILGLFVFDLGVMWYIIKH